MGCLQACSNHRAFVHAELVPLLSVDGPYRSTSSSMFCFLQDKPQSLWQPTTSTTAVEDHSTPIPRAPPTTPQASAPSNTTELNSEVAAAAAPAVCHPTLKPDFASAPNSNLHSNNIHVTKPTVGSTQANGIHPGSPHKSAEPTANPATDGSKTSSLWPDTRQGLAACEGQLEAFGKMCGLSNQQKLQDFLKLTFEYQEVRAAVQA